MFRLLCIEYKLVTPSYFLDEMQPWEAAEMISMLDYNDRTGWEQTRSIMYLNTLTHCGSGKKPKPQDVLKFTWDNEKPKQVTEITDEEKERLRVKAEYIREKYLNG